MASCPVLSVNYLWKSPLGTAYPGCQHQLVLHLLAREQSWLSQEVDMDKIKAHLRSHYVEHMMEDEALRAIGIEYLNLSRAMRTAYRLVTPAIQVSRPRHNNAISYKSDVEDSRLEDFIHAALFEQSVLSSPTRPIFSSSPTIFSDMTTGTTYSQDASPRLPDLTQTMEGANHRSATRLDSSTDTGSNRSFRMTKTRTRLSSTDPRTLATLTSTSTRSRSTSDLVNDPQQSSSLATFIRSSSRSNRVQTHTESVNKDIGKILFYAQNVDKVRHDNLNPDINQSTTATTTMFATTTQPELEIIDGNTIDTSIMRLPNPTKYIQASKNHFTIPASEAKAFCHWFTPTIDTVPDRIEGYFWYCNDCFNTKSNTNTGANFNRNIVKGRFSQKRSVERHYEVVHGAVWRPVLPEVDREGGLDRDVGGEMEVLDEEQIGKARGKGKEKEVLGGEQKEDIGRADVEMPDAQEQEVVEETTFEPRPRLRIVFRNIDEILDGVM